MLTGSIYFRCISKYKYFCLEAVGFICFVDRESSSNILDQIIGLQKGREIILVLTQFDLLGLMSDALTIVFEN